MKLALCLFNYFAYGGLQRNFLTIAQELITRGHDVTIYTGNWDGPIPEKLNVVELPRKGLSNHTKNRHFHTSLQKALLSSPVDLVVGFNKIPDLDVYYCADTCFATRVYEEKSWWYRMLPRARWSLKFEKAIFDSKSTTQVLLLSAKEGDAFQKYYSISSERLHLMPPGISRTRIRNKDSDLARQSMRVELGIKDSEKVVAFLGSDYKRKGLDRVLRALAAMPLEQQSQTTLLVIGRDKHLPEYEKLAASLGLGDKVIFVGQRDDVPNLLFAADFLAHPAYLENTGNVILEALVAGLPVICTATCGYAFYVEENGLGRVIPEPFDQAEMDLMLQDLLLSEENWSLKLNEFSTSADIYSRPQKAADRIEMVARANA